MCPSVQEPLVKDLFLTNDKKKKYFVFVSFRSWNTVLQLLRVPHKTGCQSTLLGNNEVSICFRCCTVSFCCNNLRTKMTILTCRWLNHYHNRHCSSNTDASHWRNSAWSHYAGADFLKGMCLLWLFQREMRRKRIRNLVCLWKGTVSIWSLGILLNTLSFGVKRAHRP